MRDPIDHEMSSSPRDRTAVCATSIPEEIIGRMARELSVLGSQLATFQHDLSEILEQAHVSPELMRRLQYLDGATQILEDLARASEILSDPRQAGTPGALSAAFTLGDLRKRICSDTGGASTKVECGNVNLF